MSVGTASPSSVRRIPQVIWTPIVSGTMILALGAAGMIAGQPWLLPSMGPTIFLQVESPELPSARFLRVIAGHLTAAAVSVGAVFAVGADAAPPVLTTTQLTAPRLWAATIALSGTMLAGVLSRSTHPPAAATALLFAVGALDPSWTGVGLVAAAALIVAVVGEGLRRLRLPSGDGDSSE